MPVKVRCPQCEHLINAPDRARGKAVKCPECGKAVRVPAEKAVPAAKKAAAPPPSGSMVIANLDLDRLDDSDSRICPKCGSEVSAEDTECPECGVNLVTGTLSAKAQADRDRKGPNPKKYYSEFLSDSLEFWKKNKKLSISLAINCAVFAAVGVLCVLVAMWCAKPLARAFWWFLATIAFLVPPGIAWNLHTVVIDLTLRKKKKLPKYHFDKLLGAALGLKLLLWFLDVALPLHILALVCLLFNFPLVALGLEVAAVIFASLLFPLGMSHMAMPVTIRGWMINKMSGPFFRTFPALAYWAMFLFLFMLVPIGCIAGGLVTSGNGLADLYRDSSYNSRLLSAQDAIANLPKNSAIPEELQEYRGKEPLPLNWNPVWICSSLLVFSAGFFGATAVILMRANGLYTRTFLNYLDLETMEPEVKYVARVSKLDELDVKKGLTWQTIFAGLGLAGVFGFAFGGAAATVMGKSFIPGIGFGLMTSGLLCALIGAIWRLSIIYRDSIGWFLASLFVPFANLIYSFRHWEKLKFPLVVSLVGGCGLYPIGMVIVLITVGPSALGIGTEDDPRAAGQVGAAQPGAAKAVK